MKFLTLFLFFITSSITFAQNAPATNTTSVAPQEEVEVIDDTEFKKWLENFKKNAVKKYKISQATVDAAFKDVKYEPKVISSDRKQPEFMKTFWSYYDTALKPERIENGKANLKKYAKLFNRASKEFNVQPKILMAFWGMETNYGVYKGKWPIIQTLTTLAFDPRRSEFFTN